METPVNGSFKHIFNIIAYSYILNAMQDAMLHSLNDQTYI